ncbi:related to Hexaprenyldihydroxybenzoate methyltransferase, mitochondrial [Saccharomycodes ludwigii]|uniref:Ubiquinone biosynthesis O-methyltransferase, mitochondrial n=1 Tax=Saccharomycodes ludwigii TaxID=36035 RepID=A0A376B740_9ASCO|nr:hypothetical protein SCDLUD_002572 [Saccharomycodes ludwigii]KAH3901096.1 hypothetical protein SCDLUD_002572 [Saccharomycodes ludwigii]SSD60516.1 related to Hexaprenyldihydroxybenzoate methyltransferase, mitochondrial [Saccharomycodes ludwigii]
MFKRSFSLTRIQHIKRLQSSSSSVPKYSTSFLNSNVSKTTARRSTSFLNGHPAAIDTSNKVNPDEKSHFETLAPTWWDSKGSQRILHLMNLARMDFINEILRNYKVQLNANNSNGSKNDIDTDLYIPRFTTSVFPTEIKKNIENELNAAIYKELQKSELTVLDVGCGGGLLCESLARLPFIKKIDGIDMTPAVINIAKQHQSLDPVLAEKLTYAVRSIDEQKGQYDIVTMFEMLEHVDDPKEILISGWEHVKSNGGILFLSTINRDLISWFTTIFMGEYVLKVVPLGTHHLSKYINSREIIAWFKEMYPLSHEVLQVKGTMYIPGKGWVNHDCSNVGNYLMAIQKK